MVTAVQHKDKTTITIARRLSKSEVERLVTYLNHNTAKPQKQLKKSQIKQMGDEITEGIWNRFMKERNLL